MTDPRATILVVEDEPEIRRFVRASLEAEGYRTVESAGARRGTIDAGTHKPDMAVIDLGLPDVLIVDWMLPGESGVSLARRLRSQERTQGLPILMLTARAMEQDKVTGLEAGADDYLTKPFSPKELSARIKAVLRRRAPELADDVVEIAGLRLDPAAKRVSASGKSIHLGPTEFRLLHFFMTHPERIYTRTQLLDQVWGDHVFIEERTVDVHIRRLRKELEPSGHDGLIDTVRGSGYGLRRP